MPFMGGRIDGYALLTSYILEPTEETNKKIPLTSSELMLMRLRDGYVIYIYIFILQRRRQRPDKIYSWGRGICESGQVNPTSFAIHPVIIITFIYC